MTTLAKFEKTLQLTKCARADQKAKDGILKNSISRKCPECSSLNFIRDYDIAEIVCMNCGYVIDENIADTRPEWRAFDNEQRAKRNRVGAPITYTIHDKGLSTTTDWKDRGSIGGKLTSTQRMEHHALRQSQRRSHVLNTTERNLSLALSDLCRLSKSLNLSRIIMETASVMYRKVKKMKFCRGRSIRNITAAVIYLSCRQCGIPRTLEEIATASSLDRKDIARSYRFIIRDLETSAPLPLSSHHATRFSNKLMISSRTEAIAIKMLEAAKRMRLTSGRSPTGIAAAAIYLATVITNERKTQREIAEVADVTEVTIRNRYQELSEKLLIEIEL
ncbi:MAG: transcription initiation factor IIB [Candidatus Bathyarchaeota archaeon]|nr:transcription initiation factor IIB [Candidatus Bathyarchaeota archaeon]